jgi:hypothetical protein
MLSVVTRPIMLTVVRLNVRYAECRGALHSTLSANVRLGRKRPASKNILAYYATILLTVVKYFKLQVHIFTVII